MPLTLPPTVCSLACVACVRVGRGRERPCALARPNSPFPFPLTPATHAMCTQSILASMVNSSGWLASSRDQSKKCTCAWYALCWWCCLGNTFRDSNAEAHQQIRQQVWTLWPHWISLKKTNVSMSAQDVCQAPEMKIGDHNLDLIDEFTYLGSTISIWTRALTQKSPEESAKPAVLYMSKLKKESLEKQIPDWEHQNVYLLGMRSHGALLYGSELGPPKWDRQPLELFPFAIPQAHPRRQVAMQDHITNSEILSRAGIPSMPSFRSQRRLGWLGHVHCMDDGLIPKEVLFGQLNTGVRKAAGVPPRGSWKLTNVTSKHAKLIQAIGTMLLVNVPAGDGQWKKESRMQTRETLFYNLP